jgi:hypothetical protein
MSTEVQAVVHMRFTHRPFGASPPWAFDPDAGAKVGAPSGELEPIFFVLSLLSRWSNERSGTVGAAYLHLAPDGLGVYVVGREQAFDFALNRELADFANALAAKGLPLFAMLLPGSAPLRLSELAGEGPVFEVKVR